MLEGVGHYGMLEGPEASTRCGGPGACAGRGRRITDPNGSSDGVAALYRLLA